MSTSRVHRVMMFSSTSEGYHDACGGRGDIMMHVGDTKSTSGDVQYIGGYHEYSGGCHEYIGGIS